MSDNFSWWFRRTREARGESFTAVAAHLGVHPSTCWRWAHAASVPTSQHISAIAAWGEVRPARLLALLQEP